MKLLKSESKGFINFFSNPANNWRGVLSFILVMLLGWGVFLAVFSVVVEVFSGNSGFPGRVDSVLIYFVFYVFSTAGRFVSVTLSLILLRFVYLYLTSILKRGSSLEVLKFYARNYVIFGLGVLLLVILLFPRMGIGIFTFEDKEPGSPQTAFFDYNDLTLKSRNVTFFGVYYNEPCLAFGCGNAGPGFKSFITLYKSTHAFSGKCYLTYNEDLAFNYKNFYTKANVDNSQIKFGYSLVCQSRLTFANVPSDEVAKMNLPSWAFEEDFDSVDVENKYPENLGLLIKRGISLPTALQPSVELVPRK